MYFTVPHPRPQFWHLGAFGLPRRNSQRDSRDTPTSDKNVPAEEGGSKIATDNSLNESLPGPPPPSKCLLRRVSLSLPRSRTESSSSSSDTIKDQLQARAGRNLNASSDSELLDVRGLLLRTPRGAPAFSSRLVREFRDNYDSPDGGGAGATMRRSDDDDDGTAAAAAHVLRQAHWKYPSPAAARRKNAPGAVADSPDTATTAPPSFSIDEHYHHHDDGGGGAEEEGDISAITTEQEHHHVLETTDDDASEVATEAEEPSPRAAKVAPPTLRASHLRGLRQLLWPEATENGASRPGRDLDHRAQYSVADETCGKHGTTTSLFTGSLLQQVTALTCCGALMTAAGPPQDRAFASRSDEDSQLILDSSGSSLLNLDDDEDEEDGDASRPRTDFKSIFRSRELQAPIKELSKVASLVARYTRRTFDGESTAAGNRTGESALEDTINWDFLSLHTDAFVDDDDGFNKSGLSSHASDQLFNEFLALDDSTVASDPAVSEASIATAPRKNFYPDDTVSTTTKSIVLEDRSILLKNQPVFIDDRPAFLDDQPVGARDRPAFLKEPEDGDEEEPPALHLSVQARQVLLQERMKFQY